MNPAVTTTDLTVAFDGHPALVDVTLTIPAGARTAVIGPNGSGKTTLLRAISGLLKPTKGEVLVNGHRPGQADVAHVLQSTVVNEQVPLTVLEVVRMGRYARKGLVGRLGSEDHDVIDEVMRRLRITDLHARHLRELSGGQRQRVYVAQGLAQQADVLLLDEPVTGLDLVSEEAIRRIIDEEAAAGRTVVLTTHDVAGAAACDTVVLLATHVVAAGPPNEVLSDQHLGHAYGGQVFRTPEGTLVIGDPHHHDTELHGHQHH
jgi:ABC-type Mn2+/Zn2+ transport system ATPase subunit